MKAIFRYIIIKGIREQFILTLALAPAVMFVTPLLLLGLVNVFRGREAWPLTLAPNVSAAASAQILTVPAVFSAAFVAATAAFWVFRQEMKGRSISLFILAQHPLIPPLTTTLFGAAMGLVSYAVAATALAVVTESVVPMTAVKVAGVAACLFLAAAAGTFSLGFSSEQSILIPICIIAFLAVGAVMGKNAGDWIAVILAGAAALFLATPLSWRRRWSA